MTDFTTSLLAAIKSELVITSFEESGENPVNSKLFFQQENSKEVADEILFV